MKRKRREIYQNKQNICLLKNSSFAQRKLNSKLAFQLTDFLIIGLGKKCECVIATCLKKSTGISKCYGLNFMDSSSGTFYQYNKCRWYSLGAEYNYDVRRK